MAWSRPISRPRRDRTPKSNDDFFLLVIYLIVFYRIYLLGFLGFIC